jgi:hypothetical protein
VGLYGAVARDTVNPAQFGVALSFVMASLASESFVHVLADFCSLQQPSAAMGHMPAKDGELFSMNLLICLEQCRASTALPRARDRGSRPTSNRPKT